MAWPTGRCRMRSTSRTNRRWRQFVKPLKARPTNRRTLIPKGRWHMPVGCARALAADRLLRQTRAHRDDARATVSQSHAARLETPKSGKGLLGGLAAWLAFTMPSALILFAFAMGAAT